MSRHANPVLRGGRADPSICSGPDGYVLVTSSLICYPGIPVHRSADLVHWELVGHVLDQPERLSGTGPNVEDGAWAPTIRFHLGVYYVVYTISVARSRHRMYVSTTTDPASGWTDPVALGTEGFDPSLFFDEDGRAWLTACRDSTVAGEGPGEIWMTEFDPVALALIGPERSLWHGSMRGMWIEAPHIYRRDGRYLLLCAEGGTEKHHSVVAATAPAVTGPWTADPRNPLLTHRHLGSEAPFQNVGHADLVDTPGGETWAVVLGVRSRAGFHTTGRETFLVPVEWDDDGPVFAPGAGRVPTTLTSPDAPYGHRTPALDWTSLRAPVEWRALDDGMTLRPSMVRLSEGGTPALLAIQQDERCFRFEATVLPGARSSSAGLAVFHAHDRYAEIQLMPAEGVTQVECRLRLGGEEQVLARRPVHDDIAALWIDSDGNRYRFGMGELVIAEVDARRFSAEESGDFSGTLLGLTALGRPTDTVAEFRAVRYTRWPSDAAEDADGDAAVLPRAMSVGSMR